MPNNSARLEPDPRYVTVRPVPTVPRRRPALVLALLIALLVVGVAPATAAGRGTAEAGRVTTTTAAVAATQQAVYRHGPYRSMPSKTVLAGKKSKSKKSNRRTGTKGFVGFLILLLFFGLLFVVLLIWVVARTKRRAALEQRNG